MILVAHKVKQSPIHGLGIFLLEPVAAGTIVWRYEPSFDTELSATFVGSLSLEDANIVYTHAEYFPERGVFRLGNDADIFMNHCDHPTLLDLGDEMVATRDLIVGDELTCDYGKVHVMGYAHDLAAKYAAQ